MPNLNVSVHSTDTVHVMVVSRAILTKHKKVVIEIRLACCSPGFISPGLRLVERNEKIT